MKDWTLADELRATIASFSGSYQELEARALDLAARLETPKQREQPTNSERVQELLERLKEEKALRAHVEKERDAANGRAAELMQAKEEYRALLDVERENTAALKVNLRSLERRNTVLADQHERMAEELGTARRTIAELEELCGKLEGTGE